MPMGIYRAAMSDAVAKLAGIPSPDGVVPISSYGLDHGMKQVQAASLSRVFEGLARANGKGGNPIILTELFPEHVSPSDPVATVLYGLLREGASVVPCDDHPSYVFHIVSNRIFKEVIAGLRISGPHDHTPGILHAVEHLWHTVYFAASLQRSVHMFARVIESHFHNPSSPIYFVAGRLHVGDFNDLSSASGIILDMKQINKPPADYSSIRVALGAEKALRQFTDIAGGSAGAALSIIADQHLRLLRQRFDEDFDHAADPRDMLAQIYRSMRRIIIGGFVRMSADIVRR